MKRYVIGDIHGCHDELCDLIAQILIHCKGEDFKLIFVGDYVDRGPKSKEVVELVMKLDHEGHYALMGNHEDMILAGEYTYAMETFASFNKLPFMGLPEYTTAWMRRLPKYYEDDTIIVAHAAVKPGVPMNEQADAFLMWYRYQGGQKADLGKHFYHGHTPTIGKIERVEDRTNVDTGCIYGGHLTAAIVGDDGKPEGFIQVPARGGAYDI